MRHLLLVIVSICFTTISFAQNPLSKVKGFFASNPKTNLMQKDAEFLTKEDIRKRAAGNRAESTAAKYISNRMAQMKLQPYRGKYIQTFKVDQRNELSNDSYIEFFGNKLNWDTDIMLLPYSGQGSMSAMALPGFNEPDNVWFLRFSDVGVELNNPRGDGSARMHTKAEKAFKEGAEAVIFVNDVSAAADFKSVPTDFFQSLNKPVCIMSHAAYKKHIAANKKKDWINVKYNIRRSAGKAEGKNVVGYWSNRAKETIVIGAYYDGINGNANTSGVLALLKISEFIATKKLENYNYMFIAFSGHHLNMAGSKRIVQQYNFDGSKVNCMINLNEVGTLNAKNKLSVKGAGTSPDWSDMLVNINLKYFVKYDDRGSGKGDFDPFYKRGIPVLSFSTPDVTPGSMNLDGVNRIANSIGSMLSEIDNSPKLRFTKTKERPKPKKVSIKVSMGVQPDYDFYENGVRISSIVANKAGARAGLKEGDVIVRMDAYDVKDINMYMDELSKYKKGSTIMLTVLRAKEKKKLLLTFD